MPLEAGRRLGPYEILAPLGSGGMGEVYRARDTRLDRTVAVKVLPAELAQAVDMRQRFEREARAISSLSHPHICALYDVGHEDGLAFLVMEHVEGQTLADRLAKGPLPTEELLRFGSEIADALGAAHRHGIVHRDLKPANVMLTRTGAKLLDFGVARLLEREKAGDPAEVSSLPTAAMPLTGEGAVIGTVQYMAPEQVDGKPVDARADLFALGVVLYEMATGRRAFSGTSRASLAAAILTVEPPPISRVQPLAPPALDRVVRLCLAKDPEARWQGAQDLAAVLRFMAEREAEREAAAKDPRDTRVRRALLFVAAALAGALIAGSTVTRMRAPQSHGTVSPRRLSVILPAGMVIPRVSLSPPLALSPDGTRMVFSTGQRLYLRELGQLEAKPIDKTEGGNGPFFSPDGQWLGFTADGKLKKVSLRGGDPQVLCDAPEPRGASWGEGDTIVIAQDPFAGLSRLSAAGGVVEPLTEVAADGEVIGHLIPQVLPGGRAALFTIQRGRFDEDSRDIAVVSFESRAVKVLVKGGRSPRFLPPGHLLYARGGLIFAGPFDPVRLELTGPATPVLEDVRMNPQFGGAAFEVSASGGLAYVPGYDHAVASALVFLDRTGLVSPAVPSQKPYRDVQLSPDGRRIAATIEGASSDDVWIGDLATDTWERLTSGGDNRIPLWSPDGKGIVFQSNRSGPVNLYWAPIRGAAAPEALTHGRRWWATATSVSPDGQRLAFTAVVPVSGTDIWTVDRGDPASARPLVATAAAEVDATFSPDGRFLAYASNDSGGMEVYVSALQGNQPRRQVSHRGGTVPLWSHDGREIFYESGAQMMSASIATAPELRSGEPQVLFEIPSSLRGGVAGRSYDVTPDGQHFLMVLRPEGPTPQIVVIPDFREEILARLAASAK